MLIVLFSDEKYQKSVRRTCAVLLPNHWRRARFSRASRAWRVRAAKDKVKIGDFTAPHDFSHTTRANISHEKAEQIRARIVCTPAEKRWAGVNPVHALTEARIFAGLLQWGIDRFAKQTRSASPRQGELTDLRSKRGRRRRDRVEGGARSVAEKYAEKRQNALTPFIKCTIHDKIEDNRASGAKMMGGERQRQRRGTRLACARWRREKKAGFPVILRKTFLFII